ncbi:MAG TPA: hypothetical protein VKR06_39230, partial [Ktedonosporobacter sp.]|nr:hypothetical protein [Ktedonosporobacter sp.]
PLAQIDGQLWGSYTYQPGNRLTCPFSLFGGEEDRLAPVQLLRSWQLHTSGTCELQVFQGDHYFFYTDPGVMLQGLIRHLQHNDKLRMLLLE